MVVLALALPIFLLLSSLDISVSDMSFFEDKYEEYNIDKSTGISHDDLMVVTEKLMDYLKGNRDDIVIYTEINGEERQVFREREILHLEDVKVLFTKGYMIRNVCGVLALISAILLFRYDKNKLGKGLIASSLIPVVTMILLAIPLITSFYESFTIFHEILFTNDLWLLDPKTEVLIQMYPLDFFKSMAFKIIRLFGIQLVVVFLLGLITNRVTKNKVGNSNM